MAKKHIPKKFSDMNIIRCILININDHIFVNEEDMKISKEHFDILLKSLVLNGIIVKKPTQVGSSTIDYVIADVEKYQEWSKSNFYRQIEKIIIPLVAGMNTK